VADAIAGGAPAGPTIAAAAAAAAYALNVGNIVDLMLAAGLLALTTLARCRT
jgi:hypothetical protein